MSNLKVYGVRDAETGVLEVGTAEELLTTCPVLEGDWSWKFEPTAAHWEGLLEDLDKQHQNACKKTGHPVQWTLEDVLVKERRL